MATAAVERTPEAQPSLEAPRPPEDQLRLGWLDALVRHRHLAYACVALLYVASFNGIWRVGVDSALYRGLGRSLARGDGYVFAGEHHRHAYAGMPWLLAAMEKLTGSGSPVPALLMVGAMALLTLWLVDRLIAMRYPLWVATLVTLGMGTNFRFLRMSQELMTDVPFTLGVVSALYGLERLRLLPWTNRAAIARAGATLLAGLALAGATRPTFGVLAGAIVVGSLFRIACNRDGRRRLHVAIVAVALCAMLAMFAIDPRTGGVSPMSGVYEQELVERVQDLPQTIAGQLNKFLGHNLNDAFFSQSFDPLAVPAAFAVLVGALIVLRRDAVWGLMILGLVAVTLPLSTVPRYYLMVMPFLWLGWLLLGARVALWAPPAARGPVAFVMMLTPLAMNVGRDSGFVLEQRRPDWAMLSRGEDRETSFYKTYRGGIVLRQRAMAAMIAAHAEIGQSVVGPGAHVLAYLADRRVIGSRSLFAGKDVSTAKLPAILARAAPSLALFPSDLYDENDAQVRELIRKRVLVPGTELASAGGARLSTANVYVPGPGENWKTFRSSDGRSRTTSPTTRPAKQSATQPATQPSTTRSTKKSATAVATTKVTRASTTPTTEEAERAARREAKRLKAIEQQQKVERELRRQRTAKKERLRLRDEQRARDAATRPATRPTTRPAS